MAGIGNLMYTDLCFRKQNVLANLTQSNSLISSVTFLQAHVQKDREMEIYDSYS